MMIFINNKKIARESLNRPTSKQTSFLSEEELQSIDRWLSKMGQNIFESTSQIASNAKKTMGLKYKIIGHGVFRIVYDLNNGYVLKVAIRRKGLGCNETEMKTYRNSPTHLRKHLCPVKEYGHGWIIMKKMDRLSPMMEKSHKHKISEIKSEFLQHGIIPKDIKEENIALSNEGEIIVIDYGHFREEVRWGFW
ncbi:hypothetical protein JOC86_004023 [Bacillus pakistanensis]|uniref:Protein kinase domain-containing protein n=1 Tax=Rossellomorea pakistanensis TaxID=992288 RepID=A0ABS2NI00_9BACI|nr:hypothetical protein [Bacillus pakistanensis]MBM7587450.1 hypothetical protein [Bacillus pakistanensis]